MPKIAVKFAALKYGDFEAKSIPLKKCFFWDDKKSENRQGLVEIDRKSPESFRDITTEIFHTFPLKNHVPFIDFEKNIAYQKGGGYFRTVRYHTHTYILQGSLDNIDTRLQLHQHPWKFWKFWNIWDFQKCFLRQKPIFLRSMLFQFMLNNPQDFSSFPSDVWRCLLIPHTLYTNVYKPL